MNQNTGIIVGIVALVIVVGGVYVSMNNNDTTVADKQMEDSVAQEGNDVMIKEDEVKGDEMMKKDETSMTDKKMEKTDTMMKGSYEAYSADKLARAEKGDVVLFFHASWCPSCRGLDSDIQANMDSIPAGVTILKTDYDKETELKKKYGVTSQHTLVQVDKDGNIIKKWSGGSTLSTVLSQVN